MKVKSLRELQENINLIFTLELSHDVDVNLVLIEAYLDNVDLPTIGDKFRQFKKELVDLANSDYERDNIIDNYFGTCFEGIDETPNEHFDDYERDAKNSIYWPFR